MYYPREQNEQIFALEKKNMNKSYFYFLQNHFTSEGEYIELNVLKLNVTQKHLLVQKQFSGQKIAPFPHVTILIK